MENTNLEEPINLGNKTKNETEKLDKVSQTIGKEIGENIPVHMLKSMVDDEFPEDTEVIDLPSKGVFYPNKQSQIKIKNLTAEDENILTSPDLIRNGTVMNVLLENAIVESATAPEDMLIGDRNAILLHLREKGYGDEYEVKMSCPKCMETFKDTVLISNLPFKELTTLPSEDGLFQITLPKSRWDIKFRLLNGKDEVYLTQMSEQKKKNRRGVLISQTLTERYLLQIMEVNGKTDKLYIKKAISKMPLPDSYYFREYVREVEPGVNMEHNFTCKSCNEDFEDIVPVTVKLFWPNAKI